MSQKAKALDAASRKKYIMQNRLLTIGQAAHILRINEYTLNALAYAGQIPSIRISPSSGGGPLVRFNMADINATLQSGLVMPMNDREYIERQQRLVQKKYPDALALLHNYDRRFIAPRTPKGYSLSKVKNKKLGFVYYVRYIEHGKLVPSRWSTHTNDYAAAEQFAIQNRDRLITEYRRRTAGKKASGNLYPIMRRFYERDSVYLKTEAQRGRTLCEQARRVYHNTIKNHWIPYLKKRRVTSLSEIDTPFMACFQDHCLDKGIKPQTVNHYVSFVSQIFNYLRVRGQVNANPCAGLAPLRVKEEEYADRGCYPIGALRGVFNKRWSDELSYLLCLVIYSTDMRNIEMDRIRVKDIIKIGRCRFISIPKSKSRNGTRLVPLHEFVYRKLARYIGKTGKGPEDRLFCRGNGKALPRQRYTDANIALGKFTGHDKARLKQERITFYSGRHFWKTLMNAHELGEVEEYFMGHKVSNDVAKRYNHRDKQGQEKIIEKAREVFQILDQALFTRKEPA